MRRSLLPLLLGGTFAVVLVRCSSFQTVAPEEERPEAGEPPIEAASPHDDAVAPVVVCDPTCPGDAGPCSVRVESRCIDATEVTLGDFRAFTNTPRAGGIDAGVPCPLVKPRAIGNLVDERLPMVNVDMCSARAYCAWAGKHLCGGIDGGTIPRGRERTQESAWFHGCTGGFDLVSSHLVDDAGCRLDAGTTVEVGTTCQGGVAGLSGMIGNVWEWVDSNDRPDGSTTYQGVIMGGGFRNASADCKSLLVATSIGLTSDDIGFRCCSP